MTITRKQILLGGAGLFGLGAGLLCLSVLSGGITVAGTDEHLAPVRFILRTTMERSVRATPVSQRGSVTVGLLGR